MLLKLLELNPSHNEAKLHCATITKDRGLLKEAKAYFLGISKLEDKNENVAIGLAKIFHELGDFKDAIDVFERVIKLNPKNKMAFHYLGLCLVTIGEFEAGWNAIESRWDEEDRGNSIWFKKIKKMWMGNKTTKSILVFRRRQGIEKTLFF